MKRNIMLKKEFFSLFYLAYLIVIPTLFSGLGALIQRDFWNVYFASKDFSPEDIYEAWLPREGEVMREEESDNCITELLGTG